MKKILFVFPLVVLLAAGCGQPANNAPTAQSSSQSQASAQTPPAATTGAATSQFKTIDVALPATSYSSAADNFSINFPSAPQITNSTFKSPTAGQVPYTEYRQQYSGGGENAYYTVYVYHYPSSYQFAGDYLNTAMQTFDKVVAAAFPGTQITSQQSTQILGNPALSGVITVPLTMPGGSTVSTPDYLLVTLKNQDVYIISTYGIPQANYNAFVSSFKFTR